MRKQQILRSSTPTTAKAAVAGDPGCAQDHTSEHFFQQRVKSAFKEIFMEPVLEIVRQASLGRWENQLIGQER
jgi:hypothetical protein